MKERENISPQTAGRRAGMLGVVEVDDDKRRWIYHDHDDPEGPEGRKKMQERAGEGNPMMAKVKEKKKEKEEDGGADDEGGLEAVMRYSMAAKRIW